MLRKNMKIVFFGDSLTQRSGITNSPISSHRFSLDYSGSYVDILIKRLIINFPYIEFECYNKGVGGNTVKQLLARVQQDVISIKPDVVCLFIGQNDANYILAKEFERDLLTLLDIFETEGIKVLQCSTTPSPGEVEKNIILDQYDQVIKKVNNDYHNSYVELKGKFIRIMNSNDGNMPIVLFNDGCHFSELGNILVADLVFDVMVKDMLQ